MTDEKVSGREPGKQGVITRLRGSVIEAAFEGRLPALNELLRIRRADGTLVFVEVMQHIDTQRVRGMALTPTRGLSRWATISVIFPVPEEPPARHRYRKVGFPRGRQGTAALSCKGGSRSEADLLAVRGARDFLQVRDQA